MEFYVVEMSGRHHRVSAARGETSIAEIKSQISLMLSVPVDRLILVRQGERLDNAATVNSLGLKPETADSFRMHVMISFKAPDVLFDGDVHPFILNGIPLGGPCKRPGMVDSAGSLQEFLATISSIPSALQTTQDPSSSSSSVSSAQVEDESKSIPTEVDADAEAAIADLETQHQIRLPICVRDFLCRPGVSKACFQRLAFNPMVPQPAQRQDWGVAPVIKQQLENRPGFDQPRACDGCMFLFDHQGCCYWYAIWDSDTVPAQILPKKMWKSLFCLVAKSLNSGAQRI
jgi:hypothetical protein